MRKIIVIDDESESRVLDIIEDYRAERIESQRNFVDRRGELELEIANEVIDNLIGYIAERTSSEGR